ncbi:MAG: PAS domain-containing protein [Lachnospiraceae bacterium]|jgi:signal transduction histidine kinase|nr:PAS domain-containing protein [Lachnospiraceae bacterium]
MALNDLDLMEMILTYDKEGRITFANPRAKRELGYPKGLDGLFVKNIFIKEDESKVDPNDYRTPCELTGMVAYRRNNTCFPVNIRFHPAKDEEQDSYLLAINIQAQSNLERELLALRAEVSSQQTSHNEFMANMTHELRTPINGIRGHVSAMLESSTNAGDRKSYAIIQKCCADMSFIIDNFLDFSKLHAGKMNLKMDVFNIYELMNHLVTANLPIINEKGLRIILNVADNVPKEVVGDANRLGQILGNLIANAIKFTDIGFVGIDVSQHEVSGEQVEIFFVVRDTGIGIPPDQVDKLFKSFSQIDGSSTRNYGGTGLGLMISKELVGLMGGNIRVESTPGKGSIFSFNVFLRTAENIEPPPAEIPYEPPATVSVAGQELFEETLKNITLERSREVDSAYRFGTADNIREVRKKCAILILAIEVEAWEKAEVYIENIKKLLRGSPEDLRKLIFRLGMAARREEDEKCHLHYQAMMERLNEEYAKWDKT